MIIKHFNIIGYLFVKISMLPVVYLFIFDDSPINTYQLKLLYLYLVDSHSISNYKCCHSQIVGFIIDDLSQKLRIIHHLKMNDLFQERG